MGDLASSTEQQQTSTNQSGIQSGGTAQASTSSNAAAPDISTLMASLNSILSGSANFSTTEQPQIQNLSNTLNAANTSNVNTIQSRLGGVANPAALISNLNTNNATTGMQTTEGLQSQLSAENLQALLGPLSSLTSLIGGNTSSTQQGAYSGSSNQSGTGSSTGTSTPSLFSLLFGL